MNTHTAIHIFKIQDMPVDSLNESIWKSLIVLIESFKSLDPHNEDILRAEIDLAAKEKVLDGNKFLTRSENGFSVSLNRQLFLIPENGESIRGFLMAPNSLEAWANHENRVFSEEFENKIHGIVNSGIIDLAVFDRMVYGRPDWVHVFLKNSSKFYGIDSLIDLYAQLNIKGCFEEDKSVGCIQVKNTFFAKRKYLKAFKNR